MSSPKVNLAGVDQGLMALLRECELDEIFIDSVCYPNGLIYQWKTTSQFFHSVDKNSVTSSIREIVEFSPYVQANPSLKPMTVCRLAIAYAAAKLALDDAGSRRADDADDVEKALHEKTVEKHDADFKRIYNFNPLGWLKPGEKTKARVYRWLLPGGTKEVFPMDVMKCHERPTKLEEKETVGVAKGWSLTKNQTEEKTDKSSNAWEYRNKLMTWAYAMAWAGTDEVLDPGGKMVRQCPLDVFANYAEESHKRAIQTPDPLKWVKERDEKTRAKMIDFMRDPDNPRPAGRALEAALDFYHNLWDISKETAKISATAQPSAVGISQEQLKGMLRAAGVSLGKPSLADRLTLRARDRLSGKGKGKKGKGRGSLAAPAAKGKGKKGSQSQQWSATRRPGGNKICWDFNMGRCTGAPGSCRKGLHICNKLTPQGTTCNCPKGFKNCRG